MQPDWTKCETYAAPLRRGFVYLLQQRKQRASRILPLFPFDSTPR